MQRRQEKKKKKKTSSPDLRLPEPPQSLQEKQKQRNMVSQSGSAGRVKSINTTWSVQPVQFKARHSQLAHE